MDLERRGDVALLRMNAGKANALNPTSMAALGAQLDRLGASGARALVLTGYEQFFSAGLDLPLLLTFDHAGLAAFMADFGALMLRLFELPLPVVAAINGHAVAGGCILALQADVRIMAEGKARIGLTEVPLGLALPGVALEPLRAQLPASSLLPIALEGRLSSAAEAARLGLVHEAVEPEQVLPRALERAQALAGLPPDSFAEVKAALRKPAVDAIRASAADSARWLGLWFSPRTQQGLHAAAARLKR